MAFATEHPVVAHSEYRAVDEVVRAGGRFEVVSPHDPAGDQPAAIDQLERQLEKARASGDSKAERDAADALSARRAWLEEAERTLAEFSG